MDGDAAEGACGRRGTDEHHGRPGPATGTRRTAREPAAGPPAEAGVGHLSPSSAATFTACPRRWRFRYVERLPDPPGIPALAGALVHLVLERLLAEPSSARTHERARQLASEAWAEHVQLADVQRLGLDTAGRRAYKWRVWRAVTGLWDLEDPRTVEVAATERRLEVGLGGVRFVGVVDRVDRVPEGLVVTDYKSGRAPAARHRSEKLEQVLWYAAAVAASFGEAPVRARLLYLGTGIVEVETPPERTQAAVGRLHGVWRAVLGGLERSDLPPRPGPLCAWCPYVERCPEGTEEVVRRVRAGLVAPDAPGLRLAA